MLYEIFRFEVLELAIEYMYIFPATNMLIMLFKFHDYFIRKRLLK